MHGDPNSLLGKFHAAQHQVHDKIDAIAQKMHKGHQTYATQTVLAAQPTVVIAPMPVLAPQQTLIAPTAQSPPPTPVPTVNKTKSITIAGKGKSITLTKTTEVPVSGVVGF